MLTILRGGPLHGRLVNVPKSHAGYMGESGDPPRSHFYQRSGYRTKLDDGRMAAVHYFIRTLDPETPASNEVASPA